MANAKTTVIRPNAYQAQRAPNRLGSTGTIEHYGTWRNEIDPKVYQAHVDIAKLLVLSMRNEKIVYDKQFSFSENNFAPPGIDIAISGGDKTIIQAGVEISLPTGDARDYEGEFKRRAMFFITGPGLSEPVEARITAVNRSTHTATFAPADPDDAGGEVLTSGQTYQFFFAGSIHPDAEAPLDGTWYLTDQKYNYIQYFQDYLSRDNIDQAFPKIQEGDTWESQKERVFKRNMLMIQNALIWSQSKSAGASVKTSKAMGLLGFTDADRRFCINGNLTDAWINGWLQQIKYLLNMGQNISVLTTSKGVSAVNTVFREKRVIFDSYDKALGFGMTRWQTDFGVLDMIVCDNYYSYTPIIHSAMAGVDEFKGRFFFAFSQDYLRMVKLNGFGLAWKEVNQAENTLAEYTEAGLSGYHSIQHSPTRPLSILTWKGVDGEKTPVPVADGTN